MQRFLIWRILRAMFKQNITVHKKG